MNKDVGKGQTQKTQGKGSEAESAKHEASVQHRGKMRYGEIVRECKQKLIQLFFIEEQKYRNLQVSFFGILPLALCSAPAFSVYGCNECCSCQTIYVLLTCCIHLLSPVFLFLVLLSSSTSLSLSLRSTALSWFGVESEWPVVCPHWELPCLQTLSTSTNPCRAKPLCSRTPHSLPARWVCSMGKSWSPVASVKNIVWNLLWLQRDVMFERSEHSPVAHYSSLLEATLAAASFKHQNLWDRLWVVKLHCGECRNKVFSRKNACCMLFVCLLFACWLLLEN